MSKDINISQIKKVPIGGFLFLPLIGLSLGIPIISYYIILDILSFFVEKRSYGLLIGELGINIFYLISSIFVLYSFIKRSKLLPKIFILFIILNIILSFIYDLYSVYFEGISAHDNSIGVDTARYTMQLIIWAPYFLLSKRVKRTFIS